MPQAAVGARAQGRRIMVSREIRGPSRRRRRRAVARGQRSTARPHVRGREAPDRKRGTGAGSTWMPGRSHHGWPRWLARIVADGACLGSRPRSRGGSLLDAVKGRVLDTAPHVAGLLLDDWHGDGVLGGGQPGLPVRRRASVSILGGRCRVDSSPAQGCLIFPGPSLTSLRVASGHVGNVSGRGTRDVLAHPLRRAGR